MNYTMETPEISTWKLAFKAGLLTFASFIIYFMIMRSMNLVHIMEFRALNFFILFGGILAGFRSYKSLTKKKMEYLEGLRLGAAISTISVIPFALVVGSYFLIVDPLLLQQLKDNAPIMGAYITPFTVAATIMLEGMISGLVISFALMQYFKNDSTHV